MQGLSSSCASAMSPSTVQEMSDKGSHKDANIRRMERKTSRESQPKPSYEIAPCLVYVYVVLEPGI